MTAWDSIWLIPAGTAIRFEPGDVDVAFDGAVGPHATQYLVAVAPVDVSVLGPCRIGLLEPRRIAVSGQGPHGHAVDTNDSHVDLQALVVHRRHLATVG